MKLARTHREPPPMPSPGKPRPARATAAVTTAVGAAALCALALSGCGPGGDDIGVKRQRVAAICTANVIGSGSVDMENDYIPHVIACENGAADTEALKAQAVAARGYAYYKLSRGASLKDGTGDQVYTCSRKPLPKHYAAVKATAGQILRYQGTIIAAFYVAGAKPTTPDCVAASSDPDPTNTERYVTYNQGKSGGDLTQTTLGWVNSGNKANRGCKSQNGAHCLSVKGKDYRYILHFYYGADIEIHQTTGSCVTPPPPSPDSGAPADSGAAGTDAAAATSDAAGPGADAGVQPNADAASPPINPPAPDFGAGGNPNGYGERLAGGCALAGARRGGAASSAAGGRHGRGGDRDGGGALALVLLALLSLRVGSRASGARRRCGSGRGS